MELVSLNKLEAVADFLSDDEVFGIAPCSHFNNSLKEIGLTCLVTLGIVTETAHSIQKRTSSSGLKTRQ